MEYKVYDLSLIPQLLRIFASASDDNAAYVISLKAGKTEKDLLSCLNFRANGSGYYFDVSRLTSDIGILLGTGNDCVRTLSGSQINFSKCNINCSVVGTPTHLILGGIAPFSFEIGKDVSLLHVDSGTSVDITGEGSVVTVNQFSLKLTSVDEMALASVTRTSAAFYSPNPPFADLDSIESGLIRQIGLKDFQIDFTLSAGQLTSGRHGIFVCTSGLSPDGYSVDGISVYFAMVGNSFRIVVCRVGSLVQEQYMTTPIGTNNTPPISIRRVGGITRVYRDGIEMPLYQNNDFTTPVVNNLVYDLSYASICRLGKWYQSNTDSVIYAISNFTIRRL